MSNEVEMLLGALSKAGSVLNQIRPEHYTQMYSAFLTAKAATEPYLIEGVKTVCAVAKCDQDKEDALMFSAKSFAYLTAAYMVWKGIEMGTVGSYNLAKKVGTKLFAFNAFKDLHNDVKVKSKQDLFKDAFAAELEKNKKPSNKRKPNGLSSDSTAVVVV